MKRELTFVHPSHWDDPYEMHFVDKKICKALEECDSKVTNPWITPILIELVSLKTYCQSWTNLEESDAMWRIYSHGGTSVRIAMEKSKVGLLEGVKAIDVTYDDNEDNLEVTDFLYTLSKKRCAFAHEKEVRLIKNYQFDGEEDANRHLMAYLRFTRDLRFFEGIEIEEISTVIDDALTLTNYNLAIKKTAISIDKIDQVIDSVMLNPFAPDWLSKTVELICQQNNLRYLGKSKLYELQK